MAIVPFAMAGMFSAGAGAFELSAVSLWLKACWRGQNNRAKGRGVIDRHEWSAAAGKLQTERVLHRAAPACIIIIGYGISPVGEFDEHVGVAALGRTPAHEILATQFVQRCHQCRLLHDPRAVLRD